MSHKVNWPIPLERANPWYPGQSGVAGSDARTGLRTMCEGAVFYVDRNHGEASDNNDGTDPGAPMATVQAAINKCAAFRGDTVAVMPNNAWIYGGSWNDRLLPVAESVIIATPGVRLVGLSPSGVNGVVWTAVADRAQLITVAALDVLIEGFIFSGLNLYTGVNAIRSVWDIGVFKGDNLVVRNCVFESTINIAIALNYVWYADIYQNVFWFNANGILAEPLSSSSSNLQIHDNIFHECGKAMALQGTDYSHIFRNSIFNHDARMGINATDDGITTMNGLSNMVNDNTFSCLLARASDLNTAGAIDAWPNNHYIDGISVTQPT